MCCFPSYTSAPTGPPLSLAVQSVNSTSLTLSWEPPSLAHQTGATLNYMFTCIPRAESGIPPMTFVFMTAGTHTLNGLTPATLYACFVFPTNVYGNGPLTKISGYPLLLLTALICCAQVFTTAFTTIEFILQGDIV